MHRVFIAIEGSRAVSTCLIPGCNWTARTSRQGLEVCGKLTPLRGNVPTLNLVSKLHRAVDRVR